MNTNKSVGSNKFFAWCRAKILAALLGCRAGRKLLSATATIYARHRTGKDVSVFFDEVWGHKVGSVRIPDSKKFCYFNEMIDRWGDEPDTWRRAAEEFWCLKYEPKAGDTVVDIGAGIGTDVFYFSPILGKAGKILAVEANPSTHKLLTKTCEWNGLGNVLCRQFAIVDRRGDVMIEDGDYHEANAVVTNKTVAGESVMVQGITLDALLKEEDISRIDLIKMNIEGAESAAVDGMEEALGMARFVSIACHDFRADAGEGDFFRTRKKIETVLLKHGFSLLPLDESKSPAIRDHVTAFREQALES